MERLAIFQMKLDVGNKDDFDNDRVSNDNVNQHNGAVNRKSEPSSSHIHDKT